MNEEYSVPEQKSTLAKKQNEIWSYFPTDEDQRLFERDPVTLIRERMPNVFFLLDQIPDLSEKRAHYCMETWARMIAPLIERMRDTNFSLYQRCCEELVWKYTGPPITREVIERELSTVKELLWYGLDEDETWGKFEQGKYAQEPWGRRWRLQSLHERLHDVFHTTNGILRELEASSVRGQMFSDPEVALASFHREEWRGVEEEVLGALSIHIARIRDELEPLWPGCRKELSRALDMSPEQIENWLITYGCDPQARRREREQDRRDKAESRQWAASSESAVRRKVSSPAFRHAFLQDPLGILKTITREEVDDPLGKAVLYMELEKLVVEACVDTPELIEACVITLEEKYAHAPHAYCVARVSLAEVRRQFAEYGENLPDEEIQKSARNIYGMNFQRRVQALKNRAEVERLRREAEKKAEMYAREQGAFDWSAVSTQSNDAEALPPTPQPNDELPVIQVNDRQLRDITTDVERALEKANDPPFLFSYLGKPAQIATDEQGVFTIKPLDEAACKGLLTRTANFIQKKETSRTKSTLNVSPPQDVVRDFLALGARPYAPALRQIVTSPIIRPDGSILLTLGYDPATQLFYTQTSDLIGFQIPLFLSQQDVQAAVRFINDELLFDFPFVGKADRANFWALCLTSVVREAVEGYIPVFVINKPKQGTGGGLLLDVLSQIVLGRNAPVATVPRSDEEWRKKLTATLLGAPRIVRFDNVIGLFESEHLAAAVTADFFEDRILGRSENVKIPQRTIFTVNGNNVLVGGDLIRRIVEIRLDAKVAHPWEREAKKFKHPNLVQWTLEHRRKLLSALLVVARGWFAAGKPLVEVSTFGSFGPWTETIGGILAYAEIDGFLENRTQVYDRLDTENREWEALLRTWYETFSTQAVTVAEVADHVKQGLALSPVLPEALVEAREKSHLSFTSKLGRALAAKEGTRYGDDGIRLERAGVDSHTKATAWRVVI